MEEALPLFLALLTEDEEFDEDTAMMMMLLAMHEEEEPIECMSTSQVSQKLLLLQ